MSILIAFLSSMMLQKVSSTIDNFNNRTDLEGNQMHEIDILPPNANKNVQLWHVTFNGSAACLTFEKYFFFKCTKWWDKPRL